MRVAIMQPYFFPYLGYYQLVHAADIFVIYDDVQFTVRTWMSRNYIRSNGAVLRFTLQLRRSSQNRRIDEVGVGRNRPKLVRALRHAYGRAPHFAEVFPDLASTLTFPATGLADYLAHGLERICGKLDVETKILRSSQLDVPSGLRAEARVLALCRMLDATEYINAPGGRSLYSPSHFAEGGIALRFLASDPEALETMKSGPVRHLSIIDSLMHYGWSGTRERLRRYELQP